MPSPYPSARVAVDADAWDAFRLLALRRGIGISTYLGRLVVAETKRRHAPGVERIDPHAPLEHQSLNALAAVREQIDELTEIAGRLSRMAMDAGSSWYRVGQQLRMSSSDVQNAFEHPGHEPESSLRA
jgi:hypothetical protein